MASLSSRVQLKESTLQQAERLLGVTNLGSLAELVTVMFSRYGRHLEETWQVAPMPGANLTPSEPTPLSMVEERREPPQTDFRFDDPLTGL